MAQPAVFLTPAELVTRWRHTVTVGTLANQRSQKKPHPPYVKIGAKVLYPLDKLEVWEAANMRAANDNDTEPENI